MQAFAPADLPNESLTEAQIEACLGDEDFNGDGLAGCADPVCAPVCDVDGDGAVSESLGGTDCDDDNPAVYPGHPEICDDIDNNCNGLIDDEDPDLDLDSASWYRDQDGDGWGNSDLVLVQCDQPNPETVPVGGDCDDANDAVNPDAEEICNGLDDNCDGLTDTEDPTVYCTCGQSFPAAQLTADITFSDGLGSTTMTLAFDGTEYWSTSGGGPSGDRLARYNSTGQIQQTYAPGVDWRSVFTKDPGTGPVFGRGYASPTIYQMTSAGTFTGAVTLAGGSLDNQAAVAFDSTRREYIALNPGGWVDRWDEQGSHVGATSLLDFGTQNNESASPQGRGVAWHCERYLTYSEGVLSAWDTTTGVRVDTTVLASAGTSADSYYSISFANQRLFIADGPGSTWRGYSVD